MTDSFTLHNELLIAAHESLNDSAFRYKHPTNCETEHNTDLSKGLQMHDNVHNFVGPVPYKPRIDRE